MADWTKQQIFDLITEYLETQGSAIGEYSVRELTAQELQDTENMRILTIPAMIPNTQEWVQTNMANMITPITEAVADWEAIETQVLQAVANTQGAENLEANMTTQNGAVLLTVVNRAGVSTTKEVGFRIAYTYESVAAMVADAANVEEGRFVMIAGDVEDEDTGKLYVRNSNAASSSNPFTFLTDLSGAQGLKGDTPVITADSDGAIYSDGTLVTNVVKNVVASVNSWFSDTATTGVRYMWNNFWSSINSSWNSFWGTSATDTNGIRYKWNNFFSNIQTAWEGFFGASASDANGVRKIWSDWYSAAQTAWTNFFGTSSSTGVQGEWTTLKNDAQSATSAANRAAGSVADALEQASSDHSTAVSDHNTAVSDHNTATSDHSTASSDHTRAESDHTSSATATTGAERVNATLSGTTITVTDRNGNNTSANVKGDKGDPLTYNDLTTAQKEEIASMASEVSYDATTHYLKKTKAGVTSNVVQVYSKAEIDAKRAPDYDETTETITFPATAAFSYDSTNETIILSV